MRFFEDIEIGQRRELGSFTFTAEDIKRFARQFDPQRFHLSEEEGRNSLFGGLAASGWHVAVRLHEDDRRGRPARVRAKRPHAARRSCRGDRRRAFASCAGSGRCLPATRSASRASSKRERTSNSRPEWGIVQIRNSGTNQRGELVFSFLGTAFVPRRNAGA